MSMQIGMTQEAKEITVRDIARLPQTQRDVLGAICCNDDRGHHPRTLEALERKGFITSYAQTLGGLGQLPVRVKRYTYASLAVHMAWCSWVSKEKSQ